MAKVAELESIVRGLESLTPAQAERILSSSEVVRRLISGGDTHASGAGALLSSKEAAAILDVERQRLWRWEKSGRIGRGLTSNGQPMWWRADVERLREEEAERTGARRTRRTQEPSEA